MIMASSSGFAILIVLLSNPLTLPPFSNMTDWSVMCKTASSPSTLTFSAHLSSDTAKAPGFPSHSTGIGI